MSARSADQASAFRRFAKPWHPLCAPEPAAKQADISWINYDEGIQQLHETLTPFQRAASLRE